MMDAMQACMLKTETGVKYQVLLVSLELYSEAQQCNPPQVKVH